MRQSRDGRGSERSAAEMISDSSSCASAGSLACSSFTVNVTFAIAEGTLPRNRARRSRRAPARESDDPDHVLQLFEHRVGGNGSQLTPRMEAPHQELVERLGHAGSV